MATTVTRRELLRTTGITAAATALGALSGLGADLGPKIALAEEARIKEAKVFPSVCPYCAVGCGTLVYTVDDKIVDIEGNPDSPVAYGNLCPKGAAIFQLHVNPNRLTKVLHRDPGANEWQVWELDKAMDRVAELVKKTRDETFVERMDVTLPDGTVKKNVLVNNTTAIFSLGGATMDNEWNHVQQKLMRGLGVVAIENQARI